MAKKKLPAKGKSGKGSRYERIVTVGIVLALAAIVLTLWGPLKTPRHGEEKKPQPQQKAAQSAKKQTLPEGPEQKEKPKRADKSDSKPGKNDQSVNVKVSSKLLVAIVIDDMGQDLKAARELTSLPYNLTFAVMPGLPQSKKVAELAKQNNRELLLHLPMEYRGKNGKPAPGMLRSDMTPMDFLNTLTADVASVPGIIGVNNHEGSLLTENREAMKFLMAELKARNLLFLDSLTSPKSVAYSTAKAFGLKATKRDVFLDNDSNQPASIKKQLDELAQVAKEHGHAVGIGHPHPATISELEKWLAAATRNGIEIVPVSKLVN